MRIELGKNNGFGDVWEVVSIEATPVWNAGEYPDGIPEGVYIDIVTTEALHNAEKGKLDDWTIKGEYIMDGTPETYSAALTNWNAVQKKLLEKGFCRIDDFKGVEWF